MSPRTPNGKAVRGVVGALDDEMITTRTRLVNLETTGRHAAEASTVTSVTHFFTNEWVGNNCAPGDRNYLLLSDN